MLQPGETEESTFRGANAPRTDTRRRRPEGRAALRCAYIHTHPATGQLQPCTQFEFDAFGVDQEYSRYYARMSSDYLLQMSKSIVI